MKRVLRFFLLSLIVVALGGALFGYFVYSPAPEAPRQSGKLSKGTIEVGELKRTYLSYIPQGLTQGAPLVVVMHGSGQTGAQMRIARGMGSSALQMSRALRSSIQMGTRAIGTRATLPVFTARTSWKSTTWGFWRG